MPNRLAGSLSPYLRQHQDNPVDWWPWGGEAWEKARAEDKPVFLSVGYSSCHWCHVMAHESFEDAEVGTALNRDFVSIKLDREERPDIDEVYMTAVQLSSGHGGWPMSVFLTPDKKPFFAGTYFPRDSRGDFPGFLTIIGSLAKAWRDQRSDVEKAASDFSSALAAALDRTLPTDMDRIDVSILDQAVEVLHEQFDSEHGGFGGRPKFPPHAALRFLLDYSTLRHHLKGDPGDLPDRAGHMALFTLEQMALGGLHDHVGGGVHRYSTDDRWLLPHFEKMLYDNAQMIGAYAHAAKVTQEERLQGLFAKVTKNALAWLRREMVTAEGVFASALDADSEGREGAFYVWSLKEVEQAAVSPAFSQAYGLREEGNFHDEATGELTGENVLHLSVDQGNFEEDLGKLLAVRGSRPRPGLDDKAIASWNGLTIGALTQSGEIEWAKLAASKWEERMQAGLPHMLAQGEATGTSFLDDLAYMADGLLDLAESTGDDRWANLSSELVEQCLKDHSDDRGGYYFASSRAEQIFGRTKPYLDNATPSPNGMFLRVLRRSGRLEDALSLARTALGWVQRVPHGTETILRELLWLLLDAGVSEIPLTHAAPTEPAVMARLDPQLVVLEDDGWGYAEVAVEIPDGLHINSNEPLARWLSPTVVTVEGVYGEASFPESADGIYTGKTAIPLRLRSKGSETEFEITLRFQVCTDSECRLPEERTFAGRLAGP